MKAYKNIIFDLFDTLILFKPELLPEIKVNGVVHHSTGLDVYSVFNIYYDEYSFENFYNYFNDSYKKFQELKNIDNREYHNSQRFHIMLDDMGLEYNSEIINNLVISHMDSLEKSMVFPKIHMDILEYLKKKAYNLSILSNFDYSPTAYNLLDKYDITTYFDTILISDIFGWRKPDIKIFEYAIKQNNLNRSNTVFIGDDMERDIKGAYNANIDSIYINLKNTDNSFKHYKASIKSLKEITEYL